MTMRRLAFALLLLTGTSAAALAAPATAEQASKIKAGIETYLGSAPGVVTVAPNGEQYDVKIDFAPLAAKAASPGFVFQSSPWNYKVSDMGSGKWEVRQDEPISLTMKTDKQFDFTAKAARSRSTSIYDEAVGTFTQTTAVISDFTVDQTMVMPEGVPSLVNYKIKSITYETTASAAGGDAVDATFKSGFDGLEETISMPLSPGAPPQPVKIAASKGSQTGDIKGLKLQAVKSMVAWAVANAGSQDLKGREAEVRKLFSDALPFFNSLTTDMTLDNVSVETPMGPFGVSKVTARIAGNGAVATGEFVEAVTLEGLNLPPGLVPPFATDLVPQKLAIDFKLSDYNLAEAAKVFINEFNPDNDKQTPEFDAKMQAAIIPGGSVTIATEATAATSKLYDLSVSGSMKAGPAAEPTGKATIRLKGIDEVVKALQAAPPEMGMTQAVGGILMAKGFGKADGDALIWEIDASQAGTVLVNGIDLTKMGGAPAQ